MQLHQKIKHKITEFANVLIKDLILVADNVHVLMPSRLPTATNSDSTGQPDFFQGEQTVSED